MYRWPGRARPPWYPILRSYPAKAGMTEKLASDEGRRR